MERRTKLRAILALDLNEQEFKIMGLYDKGLRINIHFKPYRHYSVTDTKTGKVLYGMFKDMTAAKKYVYAFKAPYEPKFLSWCTTYEREVKAFKELISGGPADVEQLKQEYQELTGVRYYERT